LDVKIDKQRNVIQVTPKGRHGDRKNIQPVPEILPEATLADFLFQIAIGSGNNSNIDSYRVGAAQAFKLTGLYHLEQLGLQFQRQFADLIQKQGSAVGNLKSPQSPRMGTGESTFLMAEEFAFNKV
jgi:hypothetical protein